MRAPVAILALCAVAAAALSPAPLTRRQVVARSLLVTVGAPALAAPAPIRQPDADADGAGAGNGGGDGSASGAPAAVGEEAIERLRLAYDALDRAQPERAEPLLTECIDAWTKQRMPDVEVASLHRLRGSARLQLARGADALADLDVAHELASRAGASDELLQVLQVRALVLESRADWARAETDLTALLAREDELSVAGPNPFLKTRRAHARQALGEWRGAAADLADAEQELNVVGDRIRAVLAACGLALALFGAAEPSAAVAAIERVFREYTRPSSNNPDDLPLLEELSRREAELHLALASHVGGAPEPLPAGARARADAEWAVGCLRLAVYEEQLDARMTEENRRRISPSALELAQRSLARLSGLAPDSPYVTQLPGEGFWWYQQAGSEARRRSPTSVRPKAARTRTSCAAFDDGGAYALDERGWPPLLADRLRTYRARVRAAAAG